MLEQIRRSPDRSDSIHTEFMIVFCTGIDPIVVRESSVIIVTFLDDITACTKFCGSLSNSHCDI